MKKILATIMIVLILLTSSPLNGFVGMKWPELNLPDFSSFFSSNANAVDDSDGLAETGQCGPNVYWNYSNKTGELVISGNGEMYEFFNYSPFRYNNHIKTVIIRDGVTSVGRDAFYYCENIESVTLPDGIINIGEWAFRDCSNLKDFFIPNSVVELGYGSFWNCNSLNFIDIPDSVTYIGDYAFYECSNMKKITFGSGVTQIGEEAFGNCKNIEEMTIPDNVINIGNRAFYSSHGSDLEYVYILGPVEKLGNNIFNNDVVIYGVKNSEFVSYVNNHENTYVYLDGSDEESIFSGKIENFSWSLDVRDGILELTGIGDMHNFGFEAPWYDKRVFIVSVVMSEGISNISDYAFEGLIRIEDFLVPNSVTKIGDSAFKDCESLRNINIHDGISYIGSEAFENCDSLTKVYIPKNTLFDGTSLGDSFRNCSKLEGIFVDEENKYYTSDSFGVLFDKKKTKLLKYPAGNKSKSYTIPRGVKTLGNESFNSCSYLEELTLCDTITEIGYSPFAEVFIYCKKLKKFIVDENNEVFSSDDLGVLFNKDKSELLKYPIGNEYETYVIPYTVKSIGNYAFKSCMNLKDVTITNNVVIIGERAFAGCSISSLTIPDSVKSIGDFSFFACYSIKTILIGSGLQSIGMCAFSGCNGVERYFVDENNENYSSDVSGVLFDKGKTALLGYPSGNINTAYIIPDTVQSIYVEFDWDISDNLVLYFNKDTFAESYAISSGNPYVKMNGTDAESIFDGVIGNYKWSIDKRIGVLKLTGSGDLPDFTNEKAPWYEHRFYITAINLPKGATKICNSTFSWLYRVNEVVIPDSITSIDECAFWACDNISKIIYTGTEEQWKEIEIELNGNDFLLEATKHFNREDEKIDYEDISEKPLKSNEQIIRIVDTKGNSIPNAFVIFDDGSKIYADSLGRLTIEKKMSSVYVSVEKEGYYTKKLSLDHSDIGENVIVLDKVSSEEDHKMKVVTYSDNLTKNKDVLNNIKRVNMDYFADGFYEKTFDLVCVPNSTYNAKKYELYQGNIKIASTTGDSEGAVFENLNISDFNEGGNVSVRVYSDTNNCTLTKINLIFEEVKSVDESYLSFGKEIKFAVDSEIPYFGGREITVDIPDLPVDIYYGEEKIHVGINVPITSGKKNEYGEWEKNPEEEIKGIKETFELIGDYINAKNDVCPTDEIRNLISNDYKKSFFEDCSISFLGYGEGVKSNGKVETIAVNLYIIVEVTAFTWTQPFVIWVVPFVVNFDVKTGLEAGFSVEWNLPNKALSGAIELNIPIELDAFGGVGIGRAVAVGAYGNGIFDLDTKFSTEKEFSGSKEESKSWLASAKITGELGVRAYFAGFEFEKDFAYNTWYLYPKDKPVNTIQTYSLRDNNSVYNIGNYSYQDLSYLEDETSYVYDGIATFSHLRNANKGVNEVKSLWSSAKEIYRNAQPMIVSSKNSTVVAYLSADVKNRSSLNATKAVYSVYDKENDVWSEPMQIDSDNTADGTPYIYSDGEKIYVVYLNASKEFSEGTTIEESISDYMINQNIVVAEFDERTNTFGQIQVVESTEGDYKLNPQIATVSGVPTVIWQSNKADVFGIGESNANTLYFSKNENGIWQEKEVVANNLNGIVGLSCGENGMAYIVDADNDFQTIEDRVLYFGEYGKEFSALESGIVSNPVLSTDRILYWYSNGTLKIFDGTEIKEPISGGISGFNDSFRVSGKNVYYISNCDEGRNIFVLTYDESGNWNLPVQLTNQKLDIDFFTVANIGDKDVITLTSRDVTITEDNVDDASELGYVVLGDVFDLELVSVIYDCEKVIPNRELPITVDIKNKGTKIISDVTVSVYDADGVLVCKEDVLCSLNSGEQGSVTTNIPMPEEIEFSEYKVVLNNDVLDDLSPEDNEKTVSIGYCDFIVNAEHIIINGTDYAMVSVKNNSYIKSAGVLNISNSNNDKIKTIEVGELDYGESKIYQIIVDDTLLGNSYGALTFDFKSEGEQTESYDKKDQIYVDIYESKPIETYDVIWSVNDIDTVVTYMAGEKIIVPENPVMDGYIFMGWSPEVPEVMPEEDMVFTAEFAPKGTLQACKYLKHSFERYSEVEPTCENKGYSEGVYCSDCQVFILGHKEIDAIGHNYTLKVTKSATCTTTGTKTFACSCGDVCTEIIAKLGHKYSSSYTIDKKATCTTEGSKSKHCTRSGCTANTSVTKISKLAHTYKTTTTKATISKNGKVVTKCTACGTVAKTSIIYYPRTIKLSVTSYTYNGKVKTPSVTVKDSKGKTLKKNTDYTVKYSKGRKTIGKHTVTVTFKGNYSGTKKLTFEIVPAKVTLSKLTAGSKALAATWKAVSGVTGYEVQYSTSKKFTKKTTKTVKIKSSKTKKTTIKKLKKGKKYYVRIRAYKTVSKKPIYGAWSSVKSIKVK